MSVLPASLAFCGGVEASVGLDSLANLSSPVREVYPQREGRTAGGY
jgi:hypothetical protein